jgi:ATP-dependent DNA helicase RecQ
MDSPNIILKKVWDFESFRPGQEAIISDLYANNDVFALLPTGGGKSICYQIPGIAKSNLTIVISPLVSLMQDQVEQLLKRNIRAAAIYGGMSFREIDITLDNAKFGGYDFLYLSPERLETSIFLERFKAMKVSQIIIDEAHCISQWGHDFRPSYSRISELRELKPNVCFAAFTATANNRVKEDIIEKLGLRNVKLHQTSFLRENVAYRVFQSENKKARTLELCKSLKNSSGIVYCQTRRSVRELNLMLQSEGLSSEMYHGGMKNEERKETMRLWMENERKIIVATNAFGMGIDKPDVRYVIHYEISDSIEGYFQEAGRCGRDKGKAIGFALYNDKDLKTFKNSISVRFPEKKEITKLYSKLFQHFKIAFGDGKDQVVEINIENFANIHNIKPIIAFHGLKILELNGDLSLSESIFHPAKIKLMIGVSELYNFEIQNETLKDISQFLIRKLPGVFDQYKRLDISLLAKTVNLTEKDVLKKLNTLHTYGVCDFRSASTKPTITFLRSRSQNDTFLLNPSVYGIRKQNYVKQIDSITAFVKSKSCRSKSLLAYFGEKIEPCGTCDICVRNENKKMDLAQLILKQLVKKSTISTLMNQLGRTEQEIIDALDYLQGEELIDCSKYTIMKR